MRADGPETRETSPGKVRKPWRAFQGMLALALLVVILKLGLTLGLLLGDRAETYLPQFAEEAMAQDRKPKPSSAKTQEIDSRKQSSPPAQIPPSAPATLPTLSDMATRLEQREAELRKREEAVRQKEEYLSKLEQETEKKLKELIGIQKEIQAYRAEKEEAQNGKIRSLAKIYGTMKPKEAAKLLENLDDQLVVSVISTMTPDEAGNILGNMDIKKAAKISESLSHR